MKKLTIFALAILISFTAFGQSKTVADFEESADGYKLFLYQSLLRVMNKDKNPDFNMLIRDLDHLRFVSNEVKEGEEETAKGMFKALDQGVQNEGFTEIMSFDNADTKCHVYELESSRGKSTWVATLLMDGHAAVLEMEGSLDLKYLNSLASLDMDRIEDMLPLEVQKKKKEMEEKKEEAKESVEN